MATNLTGQDMSNWLWQQSDPNTQFNTYNPATGQWSAGSMDGWSTYQGLAPEIEQYLRAAGYSGRLDNSETFRNYNAAQDNQLGMSAFGVTPKNLAYGDGLEQYQAAAQQAPSYDPNSRNTELDAYLQSQGLGLQYGLHQAPGASQKTWIQRLVDAQGMPVAVDAHNDRYSARDRTGDMMMAATIAMGAAGAMGLGGAGAGAGAGTGTGTLGAGASGAGITTQGIGAAELAGLGLSNSAPLAMAPTFGAGAGISTAGLGSAAELLGGLSSQSALFNPLTLAPGVEGLTAVATLGAGAAAPQLTTPGLGPEVTQGLGLSNPAPLAGVPATVGGSGLLNSIINSGVGQAVSTVADAVGGGRNLAGIIGGIAGATQGGQSQTATTQSRTDPRFDPYLYGDNGFLSQLQQQFNATKSGTNADITAGMNMLRSLYTSPEYSQGYQDMRTAGQGLLSRGVAGNPFTMGGQAPQFGRNAPAMPEAQANPFLGLLGQGQAQMPAGLLGMFGRNGG